MTSTGQASDTAPKPVLARIRAAYPSLSDAERRVADAVERQPDLVARISGRAFAESVGVSEATVVRFCQSIGYNGLRELKLELATETVRPTLTAHDVVNEDDDLPTAAGKVMHANMQAIADTLAILDLGALQDAAHAILGADRTEFYAVGSSIPIALDAYYRLLRIGVPTTIVTDPSMQAASAAQLPPRSVAFAVSHTGRSPETHTALRWAKDAGAHTILLTSYRNTPIGKLADTELVVATAETTPRLDAVASRIAALAVIDVLLVYLALQTPGRAYAALAKYDRIMNARQLDDG